MRFVKSNSKKERGLFSICWQWKMKSINCEFNLMLIVEKYHAKSFEIITDYKYLPLALLWRDRNLVASPAISISGNVLSGCNFSLTGHNRFVALSGGQTGEFLYFRVLGWYGGIMLQLYGWSSEWWLLGWNTFPMEYVSYPFCVKYCGNDVKLPFIAH